MSNSGGREWTAEEDAILRAKYPGGDRVALAAEMGRSVTSIFGRAKTLGLTRTKEPRWSDDDLRFLVRHYGRLTEEQLASRLKRTVNGIHVKAKRLKLGPCRPPGSFTARELSDLLGLESHCVFRWVSRGLLTAQRRGAPGRAAIYLVMVQDVEKFLKENPEYWDATRAPGLWDAIRAKRFERDAAAWKEPRKRMLSVSQRDRFADFVAKVAAEAADRIANARMEPAWLQAKRDADAALPPRRFHKWTKEEDAKLRTLLAKTQLNYREVGQALGRSHSAVDHRVNRINPLAKGAVS